MHYYTDFDANIFKIRARPPSSESAFLQPCDFVRLLANNYDEGWLQGSGPAMASVQHDKLYISPHRLQNDRITSNDIFIFDVISKSNAQWPQNVRPTPLAPILTLILAETGCSTVIYTHSFNAIMITKLLHSPFFEFAFKEHLQNVHLPNVNVLSETDLLRIPIIANKPKEEELFADVERVVTDNTSHPAVLVRNHGIFVWGKTWEEAQIKYRALENLFDSAIEVMRKREPLVFDPTQPARAPINYNYKSSKAPRTNSAWD